MVHRLNLLLSRMGVYQPSINTWMLVLPSSKPLMELYNNYPLGHNRYLKSPLPPHEFFSSASGLRRLLPEQISPIVYLTVPDVAITHATQINYGLLMEQREDQAGPYPVMPGRVYAASAVCSNLGLSSTMIDFKNGLPGCYWRGHIRVSFPIAPMKKEGGLLLNIVVL